MHSKQSIIVLALFLAACGKAHVETRIQQVYCVTPDQYAKIVEAMPGKVGGTLTGNAQKDFKIAAGQNVLMRQYATGLLKVIGGCTGPAQQPDG